MGNLAKDTTEMDLWAFDDLDPLEDTPPAEPPKTTRLGIPVPRDRENPAGEKVKKPSSAERITPRQDSGGSDDISVNIQKRGGKSRSPGAATVQTSSSGQSKPGSDFDDLDSWEESVPAMETPKSLGEMPVSKESEHHKPQPQPMAVEAIPSLPPVAADDDDEFTPHMRDDIPPVSIRPKLNLTRIERAGLIALLAILVVGGAVFYFNTISRLPTAAARVKENDFPIQGDKISVRSAVTFWRAPVTSGTNVDTVRRDTLLIPVVDFATSGGPAAIRVFFRDSEGELVGDAVSRSVRGEMKFQFAATAGLDDLAKHAAYRTGQSKPWTIEVREAPTADSPTTAFRKLFEMNIASDRR